MYKKVLSIIPIKFHTRNNSYYIIFATLLRRRLNQYITRFLAKIVVAILLKLQREKTPNESKLILDFSRWYIIANTRF